MTDREAAWDAVHEALPAGWTVGRRPMTRRPRMVRHGPLVASAAASRPRRSPGPATDETAALRALDDRLRGVPQPNGSRMAERERRIRLAYLEAPRNGRARRSGAG